MTRKEKIESENKAALAAITKIPRRAGQIPAGLGMREMDRALQRLRKAGAIKLLRGPAGGWARA